MTIVCCLNMSEDLGVIGVVQCYYVISRAVISLVLPSLGTLVVHWSYLWPSLTMSTVLSFSISTMVTPIDPDPPGMRKGGYHSIFVELPRPSKVRPQ